MTETHIETEEQSPFQEEIVLDNYFATVNTKKVIGSINRAIADGVLLLVLSGDEGSGKTMLCHKLDCDPQDTCNTVYFPRTVDSFEDVVRIVAIGLGLDPQIGGDKRTIEEVLKEITASLVADGEPLLLIFDEAENIYLATLERIRKMLDRFSEAGGHVHVLFSGRKTFLENCNQLSMCDFQNNEELHVHIEPLSENETLEYLLHSCEKFSEIDGNAVFTPEVVHNIHKIAGGNFRMTNTLAEEAIQKEGDDTSFMVLLESVKDDVKDGGDNVGFITLIKDYIDQYRAYLPHAGIGVGVLLLCVAFLVWGKDDNLETISNAVVTQEVDEITVIQAKPKDKIVESELGKDTHSLPITLDSGGQLAISSAQESLQVEDQTINQMPEVEIDVEQQIEFSAPVEEEASSVAEVVKEVIEEVVENPLPVILSAKAIHKEKPPIEIVELLRDGKVKKRPGKLAKTTLVTIKEQENKQKRRNEVREVIASNAHFTLEQLYKKRLMAGSSWYNNKKNNKYTVQIMVLTSEKAEANLKKMLKEERYRKEAGNFYIFKKLSTSDTIFVFYGEYATITQARLAQNNLPQFLRKHKPYAISVKGAMAKVRR